MLKFDVVFMFDYLFCASASSGNNIKKLKYLCKAHEFLALGNLKQLLKQFLQA